MTPPLVTEQMVAGARAVGHRQERAGGRARHRRRLVEAHVGEAREGDRLVELRRRADGEALGHLGGGVPVALPAWSALMVQVPVVSSVTLVPLTVHTGGGRRAEADGQARGGRGADGDRRVGQRLVGQAEEGDRLVALADGEGVALLGRRVVGRVAGLVGGDRAVAHAEERDDAAARDRADGPGARAVGDRQERAGGRARHRRGLVEAHVGEGREGDRLVELRRRADGEALGHLGGGVPVGVAGLVGVDGAGAGGQQRDAGAADGAHGAWSSELKLTARPEEAVAPMVTGESASVLSARPRKVIVWSPLLMVKVRSAGAPGCRSRCRPGRRRSCSRPRRGA